MLEDVVKQVADQGRTDERADEQRLHAELTEHLSGHGVVVSARSQVGGPLTASRSASVAGGVLTLRERFDDGADGNTRLDFVLFDRVLGCVPDVLDVLASWIGRLTPDGVVAIVEDNCLGGPQGGRLPTTPNHLLHDYLLRATRGSFESREHLYADAASTWATSPSLGGPEDAARAAATVHAKAPAGAFHALNAPTLLFALRASAQFAGRSADVSVFEDAAAANARSPEHIVCATCPIADVDEDARWLMAQRAELSQRSGAFVLRQLENRTAVTLTGEHAGKLFHIQDGKARWIREAQLISELGVEGDTNVTLDLDSRDDLIGDDLASERLAATPDRQRLVLDRVPYKTGKGLEMSPGARPIIDHAIGHDVIYCDKVDITDWKKSYYSETLASYDVIVLGDKLLDEVFGAAEFDYIISSHVLEHIPDFIQFFISAERILRPGGRIVKLLPDKRYTFDVLRRDSTIDDIELAHQQKLRHPSMAMLEDWILHLDTGVTPTNIWDGSRVPTPDRSEDEARKAIAATPPETADLHCFTFTPTNFRTLIDHVIAQYTPNLEVAHIGETRPYTNEFLIEIRRAG